VDLEVYHHLGSLTSTPLDLVFPWLISAFAAHLTPSETLLLWDRVIGFDSLLPLPVLAVAVLTFRWGAADHKYCQACLRINRTQHDVTLRLTMQPAMRYLPIYACFNHLPLGGNPNSASRLLTNNRRLAVYLLSNKQPHRLRKPCRLGWNHSMAAYM
jgi:hypothetical protein